MSYKINLTNFANELQIRFLRYINMIHLRNFLLWFINNSLVMGRGKTLFENEKGRIEASFPSGKPIIQDRGWLKRSTSP